jgi:glycosyltransferase involved in cell wall biosynthesis
MNSTICPPPPKKLFIVVNVDWFFVSHRKQIALSALSAGYNVTIVARNTGHKQLIESFGLEFIHLPFNRSSLNILANTANMLQLFRIYRRYKPDIIHHVTLKIILYGSSLSRFLGIATVNAISGLGYLYIDDSRHKYVKKIYENILKYSLGSEKAITIVQNQDDKMMLISKNIVASKSIRIIRGSGVDPLEYNFSQDPSGEIIKVVFPARLLYDKGILEFIEVARLISAENPNILFQVYGAIDRYNPSAVQVEVIREWVNERVIVWHGHSGEMSSVFSNCHIVVLPSYREGLPKSLIEAAACGRPIITTDSPGCRDIVIDGLNGYLVPIKDTKILYEKLRVLIESTNTRKKFGINGRQRVMQYFNIDLVVSLTMETYKCLLK